MQKNLLDTHTLISFIDGNKELSGPARQLIEAEGATNFISIASLWEMAVKISLRKLQLKIPFAQINDQLVLNGFEILPITFEDTVAVSSLPFYHRDPFDRIIIAQSKTNKLPVISRDPHFASYEVDVLW